MSAVMEGSTTYLQWLTADASDINMRFTGSNDGTNGVVTATSDFAAQYMKGFDTDSTDNTSLATVAYVKDRLESEHPKESAVGSATDNVALTFQAGQFFDGRTLVADDRILLINQTDKAENGLWQVRAGQNPVRPDDFNEDDEVAGASVWVTEGAKEGFHYVATTPVTSTGFTIGIDNIDFTASQSGTYTAGNGLELTGSEFAVDLKANGGLVIETGEVAVDLAASSFTGQLAYANLAALATGELVVGNGGTATVAALSGDATIAANGALTIGTGAITEGKILDNAVTLDKMEDGTSGDILYYGASGVPTRLAKGSDNQVLTLASGIPSWAAASGGTPDDGSITMAKLDSFEEGSIVVGADDGGGQDPVLLAHGAANTVLYSNGTTLAYGGVTSAMITDDTIVNDDINSAAAIALSKLAAGTDGYIIVGADTTGVPTYVEMTGDVTISNTGATTIGAGAVEASMLADNAVGPAQLAHNDTDAGLIAFNGSGVPVHLDAGTTDYPLVSKGVNATPAFEQLATAAIADEAVTLAKLETGSAGQVIVGAVTTGAPTYVDMTGDVLISNTGVTSINTGVVVNDDINASAAIDFSKLAPLTDGNLLVGNVSNDAASVAMSGDATITNTGAVTLAAAQTNITSIYAADLAIGNAATEEKIVFASTANEVELYANNILQNRVTDEGGTGKFYIRGTYQVFSDERIKGHDSVVDDALERLDALECRRYRLKRRDGTYGDRFEIGQFAQKTLLSCPELISITEGEGYEDLHTINYAGLSAIAAEGVKRLHAKHNAEVAELRAENATLRDALAALTARVAALE